MKIFILFISFFSYCASFAGATPLEEDTVSSSQNDETLEPPKSRMCPPPDKNFKIVSAIQYFEHIREDEGCRNNRLNKLTILEDKRNIDSGDIDILSIPHSILFHCNGAPTLANNTGSEGFMYGGSISLYNNTLKQSYYSPSLKKSVSNDIPYKVIQKKPFTIQAQKKKLMFRRVKIKETQETAIEIISDQYPKCPDGSSERALLLPLPML